MRKPAEAEKFRLEKIAEAERGRAVLEAEAQVGVVGEVGSGNVKILPFSSFKPANLTVGCAPVQSNKVRV